MRRTMPARAARTGAPYGARKSTPSCVPPRYARGAPGRRSARRSRGASTGKAKPATSDRIARGATGIGSVRSSGVIASALGAAAMTRTPARTIERRTRIGPCTLPTTGERGGAKSRGRGDVPSERSERGSRPTTGERGGAKSCGRGDVPSERSERGSRPTTGERGGAKSCGRGDVPSERSERGSRPTIGGMRAYFLDHVVVAVRDLPRAVEDWRALGLDAPDGGSHPKRGTRNALVRFPDGSFLELIAVEDRALVREAAPGLLAMLELHPDGPVSWALRTDDVEGARSDLASKGFRVGPLLLGEGRRDPGKVARW